MKHKLQIVLNFDNVEDRDTLLKAFAKHSTITWDNELKESQFIVDIKKSTIKISQSTIAPPKRLRL